MPEHKDDFERLATLVRARRTELGLTHEDIADMDGPSRTTMSAIENHVRGFYSKRIVGRLERVMRWEPGSYRRILAGGLPAAALSDPAPRVALRYADPALQHIAETPGLDEDDIKALVALTIGLRHQRQLEDAQAVLRRA